MSPQTVVPAGDTASNGKFRRSSIRLQTNEPSRARFRRSSAAEFAPSFGRFPVVQIPASRSFSPSEIAPKMILMELCNVRYSAASWDVSAVFADFARIRPSVASGKRVARRARIRNKHGACANRGFHNDRVQRRASFRARCASKTILG